MHERRQKPVLEGGKALKRRWNTCKGGESAGKAGRMCVRGRQHDRQREKVCVREGKSTMGQM